MRRAEARPLLVVCAMREFLLASSLLFVSSIAFADREGLELSAGLQGGHISCESATTRCNGVSAAFGGNLDASWLFTPKLGVFADAWVLSHSESDFTVAHFINTVGVAWRPLPVWTFRAGVGAAHASLRKDGVEKHSSDTAFAVMLDASFELVRGRTWAVSIDGRFGDGFYTMADVKATNVGLGVGVTWFDF